MTLADFLLARIAEDEQVYRQAADIGYVGDAWAPFSWGHEIDVNGQRGLAECEAKRRIIDHCASELEEAELVPYGGGAMLADDTLRTLALPYADHPDYRDEWRA